MDSAKRVSRIYAGTLLWGLTGVVVGHRNTSRSAAVTAAVAAVPVLLAAIRGRRTAA